MSGYHFLLELNTHAVFNSTAITAVIPLPPYTTLIYRLNVEAMTGTNPRFSTRMISLTALSQGVIIGATPVLGATGAVAMTTNNYVAEVQFQYIIGGVGSSITISDELEALG